jgi:23S rRNA (cytidine1920-2'-O)/16S rRNA (cytidine1409-2'-O)-methyltransferase
VLAVTRRAEELGWHTVGVTASPLPGPSGNVEYFLWLRAETDRGLSADELEQEVRHAVEAGPQ